MFIWWTKPFNWCRILSIKHFGLPGAPSRLQHRWKLEMWHGDGQPPLGWSIYGAKKVRNWDFWDKKTPNWSIIQKIYHFPTFRYLCFIIEFHYVSFWWILLPSFWASGDKAWPEWHDKLAPSSKKSILRNNRGLKMLGVSWRCLADAFSSVPVVNEKKNVGMVSCWIWSSFCSQVVIRRCSRIVWNFWERS